MTKRKKKQRQSDEIRIPLGSFSAAENDRMADVMEAMTRPGTMPGSTDFAAEWEAVAAGNWKRAVRGADACPHGLHRDGIVVGLVADENIAPELRSRVRDWICFTAVDECGGRSVRMIFDRDGVRELVNVLMEVVAESDRREREGAVR